MTPRTGEDGFVTRRELRAELELLRSRYDPLRSLLIWVGSVIGGAMLIGWASKMGWVK